MPNVWNEYVIVPVTAALGYVANHTGSVALAIIAFTIVVKLVLYPLTIKQLKSSRAQQALQPQLQELRTKYAKDKVKLNEEMMRLYRENNANPAAGCLPTLVQFPILIALYNSLYGLLRSTSVHANSGFLWIQNLALPDFWSVTDPITHHQIYNGLFILPLLAGGLQWVQQRMLLNPAANQDPQQKMMNQMMQFMPLMVIFFGYRFPAGLALYWVTNTLVSIILQYFVTGWGSLVLIAPWLRNIGSPHIGIVVHSAGKSPALTAGSDDRLAGKVALDGAPAKKNGAPYSKNHQDAPKLTPVVGKTAAVSDNGLSRTPRTTNTRKNAQSGQDVGRSRPATRKQGSKR